MWQARLVLIDRRNKAPQRMLPPLFFSFTESFSPGLQAIVVPLSPRPGRPVIKWASRACLIVSGVAAWRF